MTHLLALQPVLLSYRVKFTSKKDGQHMGIKAPSTLLTTHLLARVEGDFGMNGRGTALAKVIWLGTIQFILLAFLYRANTLSLVYNNVSEFVLGNTANSITIIFSTANINEPNVSIMAQLLTNNIAWLLPQYGNSCRWRTWDEFKRLVTILGQTPVEYYRLVLLHSLCIEQLPFRRDAYDLLLEKMLPFQFWHIIPKMSPFNWIDILNNNFPWYSTNWCADIPSNFLNADFFKSIDLPAILAPCCLSKKYDNQEIIFNFLPKQVIEGKPQSIARLLLSAKLSNQLSLTVLTILKDSICSSSFKGQLHFANAIFYGCILRPSNDVDIIMHRAFLDNTISLGDRVVFLRMWLVLQPIIKVFKKLKEQSCSLLGAPLGDLLDLVQQIIFSSNRVDRIALLESLKLDHDALTAITPPEIWKLYPLRMIEMPLDWRFCYYRRWIMGPTIIYRPYMSGEEQIFPRTYLWNSKLSFRFLKLQLDTLLMDDSLFVVNNRWPFDRVPLVRPRVWTILSPNLFKFFNLMIYSLVAFERPIARLYHNYCKILDGGGTNLLQANIIKQDYNYLKPLLLGGYTSDYLNVVLPNYQRTLNINDFITDISNNLHRHKNFIQWLNERWVLQLVFPNLKPCQLLTQSFIKLSP